jgi:hypothetical protein
MIHVAIRLRQAQFAVRWNDSVFNSSLLGGKDNQYAPVVSHYLWDGYES